MNDVQKSALKIKEPIAVFGVGVEGRSVVNYLQRHGFEDITALDRSEINGLPSGVQSVFGDDHNKNLSRFGTIFRSPSVRPDTPSLVEAKDGGCTVTSTISFFLEHCVAPVVAVTGTLGKGTCASLIAKMLEESGYDTHLGGNIGSSPLEFLDDLNADSRVVLEISSFQAMDLEISPQVGVALKTTSEHLDWHVDLDEYLDAKANLFAHQKSDDITVYNTDIEGSRRIASSSKKRLAYSMKDPVDEGIFLSGDSLILRLDGEKQNLPVDLKKVRLPGRFNLENIAAAILASVSAGCDLGTACRVAETFVGLPHRLEFVTRAGNIRFYNDSYATRPEASIGALSCFNDDKVAIILGGSEKHASFVDLAYAVHRHPKIAKVCLIGATARRLAEAIEKAGAPGFELEEYEDLESALEGALTALGEDGVVLLSPACASFGLFPNYKVRGERFRAKAIELAKQLSE